MAQSTWHDWTPREDAALFWGVVLFAALCIACGCLPVDLLRYDAVARERIDADIGARARCASGELSGLAAADPDRAVELAIPMARLSEIADLAESGVHRAQTAQILWSADVAKIPCVIGSPADDREVVTMAGKALDANRGRWWNRAAKATVDAVVHWSALLARAIVVEVRDVTPWWMWPGIIVAALGALAGLGWSGYQRFVCLPRLRARQAEAEAQHAEAVAAKDRALDEYDEAMERALEGRTHDEKAALAAGELIRREHFIRNERRRAELDSILPLAQSRDDSRVMRSIGDEARKHDTDNLAGVAERTADCGEQFRREAQGSG